jgi:hypothetical protein
MASGLLKIAFRDCTETGQKSSAKREQKARRLERHRYMLSALGGVRVATCGTFDVESLRKL